MFEIKNVTKRYGEEIAVKDVSFTIGKGMTFLMGASGSGKTTLLKIISGMEPVFDGSVTYCGHDIKAMDEQEQRYFYHQIFGFVWQDFNLLEELTVLENILLPGYLSNEGVSKEVEQLLKSMKLSKLSSKRVKFLSGGQKQRVAIARELMKHPQVILADEPTSALDEDTAKEVMAYLRMIAKNRTVIIVTHDASLITKKDRVIELDKGELLSCSEDVDPHASKLKAKGAYGLSLKNSFHIAMTNSKRHVTKGLISSFTLLTAAVLLLTTFSGAVSSSGQKSFDQLLATYGEGILDISVVGSFMSAGGTAGDGKDQPHADVSQDIGGLYEQYHQDSRVEFSTFLQAFDHIEVMMEGKTYKIEQTGSVPVIKKLLSGKMPEGSKNEIVVPESFVKKAGLSNDRIIGKTMEFHASIFNWESGKPVAVDIKLTATITGVADNTAVYEYEGKTTEYAVDDSFFFNKTALDNIRKQADFQNDKLNFLIRAKTPADMISIKDELNKQGVVPLGQFELIEDMVRLNQQTREQSGFASLAIGGLAIVMVIAVFAITGVMKKKEYMIYKINGFQDKHLYLTGMIELLLQAGIAIGVLLITSPFVNQITLALFHVDVQSTRMLGIGVLLILGSALIAYVMTVAMIKKTKLTSLLNTGDRG